ncbi:hypothetical protein JHK87_045600 [Glycine soja]|nr:hypothetical protein JHK87_045600 [Glycine soja]
MPSFSFLRTLRLSLFPPYPPIAIPTATLHSQPHSHHHHHHAVASFNLMLLMRPPPPTFHFNYILSSLVKNKRYPTVISLFKQFEPNGITPDLCTLSILINCFCHQAHITLAFSVFANILKRGFHPNAITLNTLIKGLCFRGEIKKTLYFHDQVVAQGFQLDQVSYGTLINGLCIAGETKAVARLLRKLEGHSVKPDVGLVGF